MDKIMEELLEEELMVRAKRALGYGYRVELVARILELPVESVRKLEAETTAYSR